MNWLPFILVVCLIVVVGWRFGQFLDECWQQWRQDRDA